MRGATTTTAEHSIIQHHHQRRRCRRFNHASFSFFSPDQTIMRSTNDILFFWCMAHLEISRIQKIPSYLISV
jgi:hypothetical protein